MHENGFRPTGRTWLRSSNGLDASEVRKIGLYLLAALCVGFAIGCVTTLLS